MKYGTNDIASVVVDPQNDVLSEPGVSWGWSARVSRRTAPSRTLSGCFRLRRTGAAGSSSHHTTSIPPTRAWQFGGAVEEMMLAGKEFYRSGSLHLEGFAGSGADWLERYKPIIEDGKTGVASPHKVYGPQSNDLVLQLRKRRINKVMLAGMMANLCVETHLRELLEQGFEVAVAKDATAGPRHPEWGDGYKAAVVNSGFLANAVLSTDDAMKAMSETMEKGLVAKKRRFALRIRQ